jgi:hypothetical protein
MELAQLKRNFPYLIPAHLDFFDASDWNLVFRQLSEIEIDGLLSPESGSGDQLEVLEVKNRAHLADLDSTGTFNDIVRSLMVRKQLLEFVGKTNPVALYLPYGSTPNLRAELQRAGIRLYEGLP